MASIDVYNVLLISITIYIGSIFTLIFEGNSTSSSTQLPYFSFILFGVFFSLIPLSAMNKRKREYSSSLKNISIAFVVTYLSSVLIIPLLTTTLKSALTVYFLSLAIMIILVYRNYKLVKITEAKFMMEDSVNTKKNIRRARNKVDELKEEVNSWMDKKHIFEEHNLSELENDLRDIYGKINSIVKNGASSQGEGSTFEASITLEEILKRRETE